MKSQNIILLTLCLTLLTVPAHAKLVTRTISYDDNGAKLSGYLAFDDAVSGKRPAVLVVHEWWGLNDYARQRADKLAELGYVAFAVDMYGTGKVTDHPKQAGEWSKEISQNKTAWQQRAVAGLTVLKQQPQTDPERMAAIGYCFGGGTVQQLAYAGVGLKGVVSFHGSLQEPPADVAGKTNTKLLICHGGADAFTPPDKFQAYLAAMATSGLDYEIDIYGNAKHSFTNPGAAKYNIPALGYSPSADRRSWEAMQQFFNALFGR